MKIIQDDNCECNENKNRAEIAMYIIKVAASAKVWWTDTDCTASLLSELTFIKWL